MRIAGVSSVKNAMNPHLTRRLFIASLVLAAVQARADALPWQNEIEEFLAEDRIRPSAPGGVLFVGSSSIRMWPGLETAFPDHAPVVRRGFGGSQMSDTAYWWRELVLPHRPRQVVVYAGENDIASGRSPKQVAQAFRRFVDDVRRELPDTRITYVSMKPSPSRADDLPAMRKGNALIERFVRTRPGLDYVDVFTPMLDERGRPRESLFMPDRLHMNAEGYALWQSLIAPRLR
jgi:lysophospholipase L1-like esterase